MSIVRYEPWTTLRRFHDEVNRVFGDDSLVVGNGLSTKQWTPSVDIKEEDNRYVLLVDVPGVDPKEIEVTVEDGILSIKGERSSENRQTEDGYKRVERVSGSFLRKFTVPDSVDADAITATGKNGVLEVVVPKQEKVQPRRIEVH